jgi:hypothetical protein
MAPTFVNMSAVFQALPLGVRNRVLVMDCVPVCATTGTMSVADACWDSVTKASLDFIALSAAPWVVCASKDVQSLFRRRCTEVGNVAVSDRGVEVRTMRWGNHTFEVYCVAHPANCWALPDMYSAIVTATERSANPAPTVAWNGAIPAVLGAVRYGRVAELRPLTKCEKVGQPRDWVGITVDTEAHLYQLGDGTVTGNCHGRYNYFRTSQVVLFSFYKNLAFPLPLFWYCFWSMANGTTSFDSLLVTTFNTFFTSLPPFFAGLFDKDVAEEILMHSPQAFPAFKKQNPYTVMSFIYCLVTATYQSAVFYFLAYGMFAPQDVLDPNGQAGDLVVMGNMMLTSVVITTNVTMLCAISSINYVNVLATLIGFLLYIVVFIFEAASYQEGLAPDGFGMGRQ